MQGNDGVLHRSLPEPGGAPLVGKTSTNIDASEAIIDFFEKHPMP